MKVYSVEGLIGSGKSTLLKELETIPDICCIYEPVDQWKDEGVLQEFYDGLESTDPKLKSLAAYKFQTYAYITRLQRIQECYLKNPTASIYIIERSLVSDRYFFTDMLYESNIMLQSEYNCYLKWWSMWSDQMPFTIDGFIYLQTPVPICMERCNKRSRLEESKLSIDYQQALQKKHEEIFNSDEFMKEQPEYMSKNYTINIVNGKNTIEKIVKDVLEIIKHC